MSARDPNDPLHSSQSLDDVLNLYSLLYKDSNLSVCIRNNDRETLFSNSSFLELFNWKDTESSKPYSELARIELELSKIELELFYLGADVALCKTVSFFDKAYQVRLEIRYCCGQLICVWLLNEVLDVVTFKYPFKIPELKNDNVEFFLSGLSPKCFNTVIFSLLGFSSSTIATHLNVSEKAIIKRIARVKSSINEGFGSFDELRIACLRQGAYKKIIGSVNEYLRVKSM